MVKVEESEANKNKKDLYPGTFLHMKAAYQHHKS